MPPQLPLSLRLLKNPSLVNDNGEGYTPRAHDNGMGVRQWGQQQASNRAFDQHTNHINMMGRPGGGFLRPQTSLVPTAWQGLAEVMNGRQNAVEESGGRFRGDDYGNDPAPNTRFDENQIGIATGQSLGTDLNNYQQATNNLRNPSISSLIRLQRKFGL